MLDDVGLIERFFNCSYFLIVDEWRFVVISLDLRRVSLKVTHSREKIPAPAIN